MIQKNLDYLKEGLRSLGLGDKLDFDLEKKLVQGLPAFSLKQNVQVGDRQMESTLHFRKSSVSNMIFLNWYDAKLKNHNDPAKDVKQTFNIIRNTGIAAKEAFNLLEGRAVYKQLMDHEGKRYTAWQQLDFNQKDDRGNFKVRQFHENYGFNLEKALLDLPIKQMNGSVHQNLLTLSLQKGNIHEVTMDRSGRLEKMFIEANPQFKTVNVYDSNFRKVEKQSLVERRSVTESMNKQVKGDLKEGAAREVKKQGIKNKSDDEEGGFEKVQKRSRRKGISP